MEAKNINPLPDQRAARQSETSGDSQFSCFFLSEEIEHTKKIKESLDRLRGGVAIFCLGGSLTVTINDKESTMNSGELCTFLSSNSFRFVRSSPGFKAYIIIVSPHFIRNLDTHISITYFLHNQINPILKLPYEELHTLEMMLEMMRNRSARKANHPYHKEIVREVLTIALYDICALYEATYPKGHRNRRNLRDEELLAEFLHLVEKHYREERNLNFYAQRLSLTPKYLSASIKRISGKSAAAWIDYVLVLSIKSSLRSTQLSMQQISDNFNFPNASFFGKFFKKHTGHTPREYKLHSHP